MQFGIALPTPADSWRIAKRAEDAGLSTVWFYDTQILSADIFVAMGAAAVTTKRIQLGTGVLIPSNRIAPVAANGLASLNALATGRILAGFGTGYTGRRSMGLGPHKLAEMDEYIRTVTALLRGETPEIRIEGKIRKVGFLNPDAGLINIRDPIAVSISALGPKARQLAADLGADWINVNFDEEFSVRSAQDMDQRYRAAGHDPSHRRKIIWNLGSVLHEGEAHDSARVKAQVGPAAMMVLHDAMEAQSYGSVAGEFAGSGQPDPALQRLFTEYRALYESYTPPDARYLTLHRGHLMFVRPDEDRFATADVLRAFTRTGTVAEQRDRIRRLKEAGYDEFVVQVTPGQEEMLDEWARVFEKV